MTELILIIIGLLVIIIFHFFLYNKKQNEFNILKLNYNRVVDRFKSIIDVEEEIRQTKEKLYAEERECHKVIERIKIDISELQSNYANKKIIYDNLFQKINILEEDLDFINLGVYKPHFELSDSEFYKAKIQEMKNKQKQIIKNKQACVCYSEWQVEGSRKQGQQMINRQIRLMLRAFNNEIDSAILKVKWNNVTKMEERIKKAFDEINKLAEPVNTKITTEYLQSRLSELYLVYEHQQRLYEEKEEQRSIREMMREEEKVLRDIEKATKKAEQEEQLYQAALDQARRDLEEMGEADREALEAKLAELETQLEFAHQAKERVLSQAQLTKSGHVYVISNVGAFGENVYKIGMTRRLDPLDRVKELGDASVPFAFDVHAMIYSDNVPGVERTLHEKFAGSRLNLVNRRKEFFSVSLDEIEKEVKACGFDIEFTKLAEAQQFRESVALREQNKNKSEVKEKVLAEFPVTL